MMFKVASLVAVFAWCALAQQQQQPVDQSAAVKPADGSPFYPRPAFASPSSQQQLVPMAYRLVQQQQPAYGPQTYAFQQSLGAEDRKSVKKLVGVSVLGGVLLAKLVGVIVKPAVFLAAFRKAVKIMKKQHTETVDGRAFAEDGLPHWAHLVFAGIESFTKALENESLKDSASDNQ